MGSNVPVWADGERYREAMASMGFTSCEIVTSPGPEGRHVVCTAPVARGATLLVEDKVVFAVEARVQRLRCALCGCVACAPGDAPTVVCEACAARAAKSAPLGRWLDAVTKLGTASASVGVSAVAAASRRVDVDRLMDHEADFAPETLAMFDTVSLHLAPVTGRDAAACRRAICVAAAHGVVVHDTCFRGDARLDGEGGLGGELVGTVLGEHAAAFNHADDASAYLSVRLAPGRSPEVVVRASRTLAPGDAVTLNYGPRRRRRLDALIPRRGAEGEKRPRTLPEEALACLDGAYADLKLGRLQAAAETADDARELFSGCPDDGFRVHGAPRRRRRLPPGPGLRGHRRDLRAGFVGRPRRARRPRGSGRGSARLRAVRIGRDAADGAAALADAPRLADAPTRKRARDDDGA
ncbi:hypothetical protein JL720_17156 [Aureococcus anophagefferens]|nr:hypothetical protein JL720_17156 [Aureococcus anophagefferens]